jgi:cation diffusion facilitator CzcD-associated flavoprotein CzcO
MTDRPGSEHTETLVIGGGQSGLVMGYHLSRRGLPHAIIDANHRIGDAWRNRWDSLRLFTGGSRAKTRWPTIWSPTPGASIFASRPV